MHILLQDIRQVLRIILRHRAFVAVALTLAVLGVALKAALVSIVNTSAPPERLASDVVAVFDLASFLSRVLFGINMHDLLTFFGVAMVITMAAVHSPESSPNSHVPSSDRGVAL
jgi:acetolactate synthase regulatory subunit